MVSIFPRAADQTKNATLMSTIMRNIVERSNTSILDEDN